jgi:transposase InsO family protein
MSQEERAPARQRWARLRFSIIGQLLAAPPKRGELAERIAELARRVWQHPTTGEPLSLSAKTIERMYYVARKEVDPVRALERKVSKHTGTHPSVVPAVGELLLQQHRDHPGWSYQLHYDNLAALVKKSPSLGALPSYGTVCRFMKDGGLLRERKRRRGKTDQVESKPRETRSFEVAYVNALWHFDFHEGKRKVLTESGEWRTPYLFGMLDDCSRLCCHAQWYLDRENTADLVHGLSQAIQKRGLPRAVLSDNGAPMIAAETVEGLERLGIVHYRTLPYSPEQNGKQEHFWGQVEGRLMAMLEGEPKLDLSLLNTATQAWVEQEYHRTEHDELKKTPLARYLEGPDVSRPSPNSEQLRRAFRTELSRTQRRSDGTTTVEGVRFEIPSAYRALVHLRLRVARWDLSSVELVDPRTGVSLATLLPLDKNKNADRVRRTLPAVASPRAPSEKPPGIAPLLRALMADYAATGLPPAYLSKNADSTPAQEEEFNVD